MTRREETLHIFFHIDSASLSSDLQSATDRYEATAEELQVLQSAPFGTLTAEHEARVLHLRLVQVYGFAQWESAPEELVTFHAGVAAGAVAGVVELIRTDRPECSRLLDEMQAIKVREGLGEFDDWRTEEETPDDYKKLSHEFSSLVRTDIHGPVFDNTLRRYRLGEVADLFERQKATAEIHQEIGMRVHWRDESTPRETVEFMDNTCRERLGDVQFQRILRRVAEIKATWGRR